MLRFISGLLLLAGLIVAVYGGFRLLQEGPQERFEQGDSSITAPSPAPDPVVEGAVQVLPEPVIAAAPPPPPPPPPITGSAAPAATEQASPEPVFRGASGPASPVADVQPVVTPEESAASFAERLYEVPIAYETPKTAAYKTPFNVTFAIDGTGDDTAIDAMPGQDTNVVSGSAKISDRVKASLIGSAFEIELVSPEVQRVSLLTENVWRWEVTPIEAGEHALVLELYALEGDEAVPLRTYSDQVVVSVSSFQKAVSLATTANPLFVVLGGLGSALGGFFGVFKFFRRG